MDKTVIKKFISCPFFLVVRPVVVLAVATGVLFSVQGMLSVHQTEQSNWFSDCRWSRAHASMDADLVHGAWCTIGKMIEDSQTSGSLEADFVLVPRH